MFNSASPYGEGRKDGFSGAAANRGHYDDAAWAEYLTGYADGVNVAAQSETRASAHLTRENDHDQI